MACKPGSVSRCREDGHSSGMSVAAHLARPTRTAIRKTDHMPSLFGLAPGGACHAVPVAGPAVRSYRTISTLLSVFALAGYAGLAVSFLWRCPWGRPRRMLSVTVSFVEPGLSSLPVHERATIRPSDARGF